MTKRTWGDDIFAGFSPKPAPPDEWKDAPHMTNANALPIQERLREHIAGGRKFDDHAEAADHIDALEKALRFITECYEYGAVPSGRSAAIANARAALGEGE